jgi:hypothetical protein
MDAPTIPAIAPGVWGRPFWDFLDAIVATFPRDNPSAEHRSAVFELLTSLRVLLPCPTCRKHYNDFVQKHPLDNALVSRRDLVLFYFLLQKDVSGRTKKNMLYRNPDELWASIVRRTKSVAPSGARTTPTLRQPFRVPARRATEVPTVVKKKGCNCGK